MWKCLINYGSAVKKRGEKPVENRKDFSTLLNRADDEPTIHRKSIHIPHNSVDTAEVVLQMALDIGDDVPDVVRHAGVAVVQLLRDLAAAVDHRGVVAV